MASLNLIISGIRKGLRDTWVWRASMLVGATFDRWDIPICPANTTSVPKRVISWTEAKALYKKEMRKGNKNFQCDAFIHFYLDDYKFDGLRIGIWAWPKRALKIIKHFAGVITPDFSTYQDFPIPIKLYNTYRMRTFGYWLTTQGVLVINNVRWGSSTTWDFDFSGIPKGAMIAIGTVGGSPYKLSNREIFNRGFDEMLARLEPTVIVVVGSANYPCFDKARALGIKVVEFKSKPSSSDEEV